MQVSRCLSLILLGMTLDSCSERQFDSKIEGEKLLARDAEWADLATAGKDVEKVVSYWAMMLSSFSRDSLCSRARRRFVLTLPPALIPPDSRSIGSRKNLYSPPMASLPICAGRTSSLCLG